MVGMARGAGARVVLGTVVWNDFEPPFGNALAAGATPKLRADVDRLRGEALVLVPPRFRPGLIQTTQEDSPLRLQPTDWGQAITPEVAAARRAANAGLATPALRELQGLFAGGPFIPSLDAVAPDIPTVLDTFSKLVERRLSRTSAARWCARPRASTRSFALRPITP